ncbi:MAG: hypothetical protein QNJ81_02290 [Acidimicrobiia bacterium]|nr:hypothetical protein [Acidimicrobiia bacterium]
MASQNVGKSTTINIFRRRGDTKTYVIRLLTAGTTNPIDVTGYSAVLTVHSVENPTDNTTEVFAAPGAPTTTPADGRLEFDFSLFTAVAVGEYWYDIEITDNAGLIDTPILGQFTVEQDRTIP